MSHWFIVLFGLALAAQPGAADNPRSGGTNSSVEIEFRLLQAQDDAAQADVDKWMRENTAAKTSDAGLSDAVLEQRINARFAPVETAYKEFLQRHPEHAQAHLAYGCLLNDRQNELGALREWEKALELDPKNPDTYNNLAGRYTESGPVDKAFTFYAKAIELKPTEALYYHNFANALYVLRKRAMTYYGIDEGQVFAKIIGLYSNSVRLAPTNFTFASDLAQTYYSRRPFLPEPALQAWSNTLQSTQTQFQREEVYIHLARVTMLAGRLAEARNILATVTNQEHALLKSNLLYNISRRESPEPEKVQRGEAPTSQKHP